MSKDVYNEDLLNFSKVKPKEIMIKVPKCQDDLEKREERDFYLCLCFSSEESYNPICEHCKNECHKDHKFQTTIRGIFDCMCKEINHNISERHILNYEKKIKEKYPCFFNEFLNITNSTGISNKMGENFCSICIIKGCPDDNISDKIEIINTNQDLIKNEDEEINFKNKNITNLNEEKKQCTCSKNHKEMNIVNFYIEQQEIYFKEINKHFLNFNFNIIKQSAGLKVIFIDFLLQRISNYFEAEKIYKLGTKTPRKSIISREERKKKLEFFGNYSKLSEGHQNNEELIENSFSVHKITFLTDTIINTLLKILDNFKKYNPCNYLHIYNFFYDKFLPNDLLEILDNNVDKMKLLKDNSFSIYLDSSIKFFSLLFNVYIKSHFLNFNNLFNLKTILNLNILQRFIYLHESKSFYQTSYYKNDKNFLKNYPFKEFGGNLSNWLNFVEKLSDNLIKMLDLIQYLGMNSNNCYIFIMDNLKPICIIFKFLFKYNIISQEKKLKFLRIIDEIIGKITFELETIYKNTENYFEDLIEDLKQLNENGKKTKINVNPEEKKKLEILKLNHSKLDFMFPVTKIFFYYILHINDCTFIMNKENCKTNHYSFKNLDVSKHICKPFLNCVNYFNKTFYTINLDKEDKPRNKNKLLKIDLYIKKIMELLLGNNEFYHKSLNSLLFDYISYNNKIFKLPNLQIIMDEKYLKDNKLEKFNFSQYSMMNFKILNYYSDNPNEKLKDFTYIIDDKKKIIMNNFILKNTDFGLLNKSYYEHEINFNKYIRDINKTFEKFNFFLNNSLGVSFSKNENKNKNLKNINEEEFLKTQEDNFNNRSYSNFQSLEEILFNSNTDNIKDFKYLIGFTDFIENLNELLDIFSIKKEFFSFQSKENKIQLQYDNDLTKENKKFLLRFLSLIAYENYHNFGYLLSINIKNLVNTFIDEDEELFEFFEIISNLMINNEFLDNYYFITDFLKNILKTINIDKDHSSYKDLKILAKSLKIFSKIMKKFDGQNNEIVNLFELIQEKIISLQVNENLMFELNDFIARPDKFFLNLNKENMDNKNDLVFQADNVINTESGLLNEEKINSYTNDEKDKRKMNKHSRYKIFDRLIKSYFKIINICYEKNLNYYNYFNNPEFFLFKTESLINSIETSRYINIVLREEIEKYIQNLKLKSVLNLSNLDDEFSKFHCNRNNKNSYNSSLLDDSEVSENLDFTVKFMKNQICFFLINTDLENICKKLNENKSSSKLKKIFFYLENSIINPLYNLINIYLVKKNNLTGNDFFSMYELINYFHKLLKEIYNNQNIKNYKKPESEKKLFPFDRLLEIKISLIENELNDLENNIDFISKLKYFELESLINKFRLTLNIIKPHTPLKNLHIKKKLNKYKIIENSNLKCFKDNCVEDYNKTYTILEKEIISKFNKDENIQYKYFEKVNNFVEHLSSCFGKKFALINCLHENINEDLDLYGVLLDYLLNKFTNVLTEANADKIKFSHKYSFNFLFKFIYPDINESLIDNSSLLDNFFKRKFIEAKDLKIQNFYALIYLRNLIYFDPINSQNSLLFSLFENNSSVIEKKVCLLSSGLINTDDCDFIQFKDIYSKYNDCEIKYDYISGIERDEDEIVIDFIMKHDKFFNLIKILIKYFIFGNINLEIAKIFQITNINNYINSDFVYEFAISSIFIIQNLCENHNQKIQDNLYNLFFYPKNNLISSKEKSLENLQSFNQENDEENYQENDQENDQENEEENNQDIDEENNKDIDEKNNQENKEDKKNNKMIEKKFSFIELNFVLMQKIIENIYFDYNKKVNHINLLYENNSKFIGSNFRNNSNLMNIYGQLTDLLVEMIQGTKQANKDKFFKKIEKNVLMKNPYSLNNLDGIIHKEFWSFTLKTKKLFDNIDNNEEKNLCIIKKMNFEIFNNLLKNFKDISTLPILEAVLDIKIIIKKISFYVKQLIYKFDRKNAQSPNQIDLKNRKYEDLSNIYRDDDKSSRLSEDNYFLVCEELFLFLNLLEDESEEVKKLMNIDDDENVNSLNKNLSLSTINTKESNMFENSLNFFKKNNHLSEKPNEGNTDSLDMIEDFKFCKYFFTEIIRSVEFVIEENENLVVKKIVFVNPSFCFYLDKENLNYYFETKTDRTNENTKINFLLDSIDLFKSETDYKSKYSKGFFRRKLLEINYKNGDLISFTLSLIINMILLLSLDKDSFSDGTQHNYTKNSIFILGLIQLAFNVFFILSFMLTKYNLSFYNCLSEIKKTKLLSVQKNNKYINDDETFIKKLSFIEKIQLYFVKSVYYNDDIFYLKYYIVSGIIGVSDFRCSFIFTFQLILIARFSGVINDFIIAIKSRINQILYTLFFIIIVIYFFTAYGFFVINPEFTKVGIEKGKYKKEVNSTNPLMNGVEFTCETLARCLVFFINQGIRNGGGIGDVLDIKGWSVKSLFFERWILDVFYYLIVILLLLNMVNGIIITTFTSIRDSSDKNKNDIDNKCFICSIDKYEFEKRKLSFKDHKLYEHNTLDYINYIIYLKNTKDKDLDSHELYIKENIKQRNINIFPLFRAKALGESEFNHKEDDD